MPFEMTTRENKKGNEAILNVKTINGKILAYVFQNTLLI